MIISRKPTFQELCERAGLRQAEVVRRTGLSIPTVQKIMRGQSVRSSILRRALEVVNDELATTYTLQDIDAEYT